MHAAVTFIMPTLRQRTGERERALNSLLAQTDPDWGAVICGDGFTPVLPLESRFFSIKAPEDSGPGRTRNLAIRWVNLVVSLEQWDSDWLAFIDDDDTVSPRYVERLKDVGDAADVVVFRMRDPKLGILPNLFEPSLCHGHVGISFAVRRAFAERHGVEFTGGHGEDQRFLVACGRMSARILIHPSISYFVKDTRP